MLIATTGFRQFISEMVCRVLTKTEIIGLTRHADTVAAVVPIDALRILAGERVPKDVEDLIRGRAQLVLRETPSK